MKSPFLLLRALAAALLSAAVLFSLSLGPVSCSMGGAVEDFLPEAATGSDGSWLAVKSVSPPVLKSFSVDSSESLLLNFDKLVSVCDAGLFLSESEGASIAVVSEGSGDGTSVRIHFAEETCVGKNYELRAVAKDEEGNSLSFSVSFAAFNPRVPDLLLCELRNAYSSKANKYEFVRLYCAKGGNLSGLELVSAGDGEAKKFVFPPVELAAGDYVCVHLRKMKEEDGSWKQPGMVDELGGDISASTAVDSADDAWDFWQDNQKSRLAPSDIVLLRNAADGRLLDALLFRDPKKEASDWDAKYKKLCGEVEASGCWLGEDGQATAAFASAFAAEGITSSAVTRTMVRRNLECRPSSAADWYVKR